LAANTPSSRSRSQDGYLVADLKEDPNDPVYLYTATCRAQELRPRSQGEPARKRFRFLELVEVSKEGHPVRASTAAGRGRVLALRTSNQWGLLEP
jgi:hypothetical protein